MKKILLQLFSAFIFLSINNFAQPKGHLVIIGGGERDAYIMEKIVGLAGGKNARMVIIPNASESKQETGEYQSKEILHYGAASCDYMMFTKETADDDSNLAKLDNITGIFFSGGDQALITKDLLGTRLLDKIYKLYNNGAVISGTSAGAAIMSEVMLTGNELINKDTINSFITIQKNNVEVKQGLGFLKNVIIDQHFLKRKRHNRLISVVLQHPELPAIAIDEETAIIVSPDNTFEVLGENQVLIYDATNAGNIRNDKNGNLGADNIKMHLLITGDRFDMNTKQVIPDDSKEKL